MSQEQIEIITVDALLAQAKAKQTQGQRLVQISATKLPTEVELTYSFDLNRVLTNFRLSLPDGTALPSISGVFGCAVLYENEIHDLFGVPVNGLTIDFKGNFYKTSVKYPFGSTKAPAAPVKAPVATPAIAEAKQ